MQGSNVAAARKAQKRYAAEALSIAMRLALTIFAACVLYSCRAAVPEHSVLTRENSAGQKPVLLLLSVDGLMPRHVLQAHASGAALPNLLAMVADGAYAAGVRTVVPSLTYPAHTTILTGVSPSIHGITSNIKFDPLGSNLSGWYWYADDIRAPTLWSLARQAHLVTANVCWPVSVNATVDFNFVQFWRAALPDDEKLYGALSSPNLVNEFREHVGPIPFGDDFTLEADDMRVRFTEYLIAEKHPALVTAYLGSLDAVQHLTGPNSLATRQYLEHLDADIGALRLTIEASAPGRSIFAVVSDHGFIEYDTEIELGSLFRDRQLLQVDADTRVTSWLAFPWVAGGTAAIILKHPSDSSSRQSVERLIEDLQKNPDFGVLKVYRDREILALSGFANSDYVLALKPGFKFGRNLVGPTIVRHSGGTHGYLPDLDGMDAAFFAVGRGIPRGHNFGRIDMRDIAPTLAHLLTLPLKGAEGHSLL